MYIMYSIHIYINICDTYIFSTLTLPRSIGFMMDPWKNFTVVKCLLKNPSSSRSGGFLRIEKIGIFLDKVLNFLLWVKSISKLAQSLMKLKKQYLNVTVH